MTSESTAKATPRLSIVFVSYNSSAELAKALASLERAEPAVSFETIVVDNGSSDLGHSIEVCRQHGARIVALGRNAGYGAAANRGARQAKGVYLAVANPDLVFRPGVVESLTEFLDRNPAAGLVGPQLVYTDGTFLPSARRFPRLRYVLAGRRSLLVRIFPGFRPAAEFLYQGIERATEPVQVEAVVGTFMVFRRVAFDEVRGFDEDFFLYAEDIDICRRLRSRWKTYVLPYARMTHAVGQTRRRFRAMSEFQRLRSLRRFFRLDSAGPQRGLLDLLFTGYLAGVLFAGLLGVWEFEYSWGLRPTRKTT